MVFLAFFVFCLRRGTRGKGVFFFFFGTFGGGDVSDLA
jgi:hypothetical protein